MTSQVPKDPANKTEGGALSRMLGGGSNRLKPYTAVMKSLEQIGLTPKIMDVMIGDDTKECLVVPMEELIYREWQYMSGVDASKQQ